MAGSPPPGNSPASTADQRSRGIRHAALVAIVTNTGLTIGQIVVGLTANAFSLVADAAHTLSDLFTDLLVLFAGKHGANPPDADHPYGHARIETIATLFLGAILCAVGAGFLLASGNRLQHMDQAPAVQVAALYMALVTLLAKELLFRFTLKASKRLRAPMLEANAWHARSDAASSLVVAIGIAGSLAGYPFLEPLAAAVVGFLIVRVGVGLGWRAIRELIDTGLRADEVARLRETVRATPGVLDSHDLRTRRMADRVLVDTHVRVSPHISVSEGHRISNRLHEAIRSAHPEVRDVLVHVDVEDDHGQAPSAPDGLPERADVTRAVIALLDDGEIAEPRIQLHYLGGKVEAEVLLDACGGARIDHHALKCRTETWLAQHPEYRAITFFVQSAPH